MASVLVAPVPCRSSILAWRRVARRRAVFGSSGTRWKSVSQMLLRRDSEAVYHQAVRALIDPWLCSWFRRPATWSCRRKDIRCLVCVADYLRERDPQERRRMRVNARFVFKDQRSQSCSIATHVIACHDDMGENRICVACKKRCASEHGVFIHQTTSCKQLEHLQPSSQPSTATGASSSTTVRSERRAV